MSLPNKAEAHQIELMRDVERALRSNMTQANMIKDVKQVIRKIAGLDETVGKTISSMTVT